MTNTALRLVEKNQMDKQKPWMRPGPIERSFGKGSIMKLGQQEGTEHEAISTGSLSLDIALGSEACRRDGSLKSTVPEISGKTTWPSMLLPKRKSGGTCAFIDAEHALDPIYAGKLGSMLVTSDLAA